VLTCWPIFFATESPFSMTTETNTTQAQISDTPNLDDLRNRVEYLQILLANPEPGVLSWHAAYQQSVLRLLEFFHQPTDADRIKDLEGQVNAWKTQFLKLKTEKSNLEHKCKDFYWFLKNLADPDHD
jgi:hypothetical protein